MSKVYGHILKEDLLEIVDEFASREEWENKTILITGASGLIGSQIAKSLHLINKKYHKNIRILAYVRSEEKAKKVFGDLVNHGDISIVCGDINEPIEIEETVHYIIHGASATSSSYFVSHPVETIRTAIDGTTNILEFARKQESILGIVYLSSLEVYGVPSLDQEFISENNYGYIDILNVRSSYSEGKRMVECLCKAYAQEYNLPVKIARLSQTFGPGVEYNDTRVFAEFARCVLENRDIILHTEGKTVRSYCYTKDAVKALFYILFDGVVGEAYNVTNMNTAISIYEMARMVADQIALQAISVQVIIPDNLDSFGYNPEMIVRLDSQKLQSLGWQPSVGIEEMFRRLIQSLKNRI